MTRQIAFFGGSFNPPHVAHQMVCLLVLETCPVDAVWMVPTYRHAFAKDLVDFEDRCRMCELAARALGDRVEVSRIEAEIDQQRSRTLDTLQALCERHPDVRFRLIIGADILSETAKWYRWDEVVALAPPIVVGRSGYRAVPEHGSGAGFQQLDLDLPRVSSTEVRERLSRGQDVLPLLPRVVLDYIAERGLYR
jgi:nicotinate-nucleotide adenylyltransferase